MHKPLKIVILTVDSRAAGSGAVPSFGASPQALFQGFEMFEDEVEVHVLSCHPARIPGPEKLAANIWFHGLVVPPIGHWKTLYSGCALAVRKMVGTLRPDIVHAQGSEKWCAVSAAMLPYPKILTIHGNLAAIDPLLRPKPRYFWKLQTILQKVALPRFDGVFCNSDYTQECLRASAKRTWRVDNPVRSEFFAPLAGASVQNDVAVLLNVGVFQTRKRQLELLGLAKRLHGEGLGVRFRFIGGISDDAYGRKCRELLREGEALGYAEYGGMKSAEELVAEMDRAPGMIHCPIEEAFGLVVAESLARGQKFFGSAVGGINDIAGAAPGCELFGKDDWKGLAEAIRRWVRDGARREPEAADLMAARYSPQIIASTHLRIYRELLEAKRQTSAKR